MPIRRFNFTGRKRIGQHNVTIELHETGDGNPPTFSATLNLAELRLPEDAKVIIAANKGWGGMRFDWGTVGSPTPPADRSLTEVPVNPYFRVTVLDDSGKYWRWLIASVPSEPPGENLCCGLKRWIWCRKCGGWISENPAKILLCRSIKTSVESARRCDRMMLCEG